MCTVAVGVGNGETVSVAFARHVESGECPQDAVKVKAKYKCSMDGCSKRGVVQNLCFGCRKHHCLKHRHEFDHGCASASGQAGGASSSAAAHLASKAGAAAVGLVPSGQSSLDKVVAKDAMICLNMDESNSARSLRALFNNSSAGVVSDCDEQLLLSIPFTKMVKLGALLLRGPAGSAPKSLRLFINSPDMDFDDAEDAIPALELDLSERQAFGHELIMLDNAAFLRVDHLTLFVASNQAEGEVSVIDRLAFYGPV
ncbi:thioredoxin family protein [Thecamonas trahens ATCC 50062]|uniref:Thioredoxin family protein n=1 Tax=Thecamonas trahens ATCC 50062 TaxID=461836 RepID=A0A0L0DTX0_THETB|nr:thioredoxin family protein [Thecamonas trahens ATCC 50062]KNC55496.1 thioredoxin family protein [Thecamonas trahens ATCC 50062]|eukprot:XP_013761276.1 thioredoxin family protein [Thecamonas trahens ATCC 50062]